MEPDASPDEPGRKLLSSGSMDNVDASRMPYFRSGKVSFGDKIALGTAVIHTLILIAAIVGLAYAAKQLNVAVRGTQYQNAILIIDQSAETADRLRKENKLLDVLENKNYEKTSSEEVEEALERYQSLLFKASVLEENELMPAEFWTAFITDFCDRMYNRYPYIQGWWGRQKIREPYASLSERYRNLSYECVERGSRAGGAR
jgi:hypothetical protein